MPLQTSNPMDTVLGLQLPPGQRGYDETPNIAGQAQSQAQNPYNTQFFPGIVIRASTGAYSVIVRTSTHPKLPCLQSASTLGSVSGFGVTDHHLVSEGEQVLVFVPDPRCNFGIIICVLPAMHLGAEDEHIHVAMLEPESGAAQFTEQAHLKPHTDNSELHTLSSGAGRAVDVFPGNQAWHNELGIGIAIRNLMAHLKASDRAKVETFILDDLVRVVSGQYQHFHALGATHIHNSEGNCTFEFSGSPHQCEVQGMPDYDIPFVEKETVDSEGATQTGWKLKDDDQMMMRRVACLLGHLPGMFHFFIASPEKETPVKYATESKDPGLFHLGIEDNGRMTVRSASDIRLERTDHIQAPKKLREAWDPDGGRHPGQKAKRPWKWGDDDIRSRPLQERDASKAWLGTLYSGFMASEDDWYIPEESELTPPREYDTVSEREEDYDLDTHARKTCSVTLRKDGGITLREDEGAEVSLIGGRVIISAPKGIELRSGKSIVNLAQEDVILKGKGSVDISATDHDVRIKAQNNMHAYAGDSMLLECDAESESSPSEKPPGEVGEDFSGQGLVLKAMKSRVLAWGKVVHLASVGDIIMETVEAATGKIMLVTERVHAACKSVMIAAGKATGLLLTEQQAMLVGNTVMMLGKSSANVIKGSEAMVPLDWTDIGSTPHSSVEPALSELADMHDDDAWLEPFEPDKRENWMFSFRNAEQAGTDGKGDEDFRMYESLWAFMSRKGAGATVKQWKEEQVNETYPWPAKENYEGSSYYELSKEMNVSDTKTGMPKPLDDRAMDGASTQSKDFNNYRG